MANYQSIHTGEVIDAAVSKVPKSAKTIEKVSDSNGSHYQITKNDGTKDSLEYPSAFELPITYNGNSSSVGAAINNLNVRVGSCESKETGLPMQSYSDADFAIADDNGGLLAEFSSGHIKTKNFDSSNIDSTITSKVNSAMSGVSGTIPTINVLILGNSYSRDAFAYLPMVLESLVSGIKVNICILYESSCTLEKHATNLSNNTTYQCSRYQNNVQASWQAITNVSFKSALQNNEWDMVFFHQASSKSADWSTILTPLTTLCDFVFNNTTRKTTLGWMITPAYNNTRATNNSTTSDAHFWGIVEVAKKVTKFCPIDVVIPQGTAIQNARKTTLGNLANNMCASDNVHLNEGIPCLVSSYSCAMSILDFYKIRYSLYGDRTNPTQSWVTSHNVPEQNGTSVGADSTSNLILAQKCAILAKNNPYEISLT